MRDLILKLEDTIFLYSKCQIEAGADIIQTFDSGPVYCLKTNFRILLYTNIKNS